MQGCECRGGGQCRGKEKPMVPGLRVQLLGQCGWQFEQGMVIALVDCKVLCVSGQEVRWWYRLHYGCGAEQ